MADVKIRPGLTIWLPNSHEPRRVAYKCEVPVGLGGRICGHPFYEGEERARDRHVAKCAQQHAEEIQRVREAQHPSIMRPWDPEFADWLSEHRDAVLEGRKTV